MVGPQEGAGVSCQPVYGFPCVSDPHDFIPDGECCSPAEIEVHRLACANYGKPSYQPNKGCFTERSDDGTLLKHVLRTSWGIGTNLVRCCDECKEPVDTFVECHGCHRDYCEHCWPAHDRGDEP